MYNIHDSSNHPSHHWLPNHSNHPPKRSAVTRDLSLKIFHSHDGRLQLHKQAFTRTSPGTTGTQGLHLTSPGSINEKGSSWDNGRHLFVISFFSFLQMSTSPPTCCVRFPNFCTMPSTCAGVPKYWLTKLRRGENHPFLPLSFPYLLAFCTLQLSQPMGKLCLIRINGLVGWNFQLVVGWFYGFRSKGISPKTPQKKNLWEGLRMK